MKFKKNSYKVHRYFGLAIMIPVCLWAISGIMHPFIANWFRPEIAKTFLIPEPIPKEQLSLSLKEALSLNRVEELQNARVIKEANTYYYQVDFGEDSLVYIDAIQGNVQPDLDQKYAETLGRAFLKDEEASLLSAEKISAFTSEYREINRFLPVWKLTFDRPDGMEVYISTKSSRLGAFNTTSKKIYLYVFNYLHNWGFIPNTGFRLALIVLFSFIIFLTAITGLFIYGFAWKKFKKSEASTEVLKKRKSHRRWGLGTSFFMLLFSFSGCYHAFMKFEPDVRQQFYDQSVVGTEQLNTAAFEKIFLQGKPVLNFSLAKVKDEWFYRVELAGAKFPEIRYLSIETGEALKQGDKLYAEELAVRFSTIQKENIAETSLITQFKGEYGFVNKRLPVQKVLFSTEEKDAYYIETSTGKLAAKVQNRDRWEGYSFAFLHKFHFIDVLGKNVRDFFALFAALSLVILTYKGLKVYLKWVL